MLKKYGIFIFSIVLAVHLSGIYFGNLIIERITKPLIVILLVIYFIGSTKEISSGLKKWILFALVFSLAGDVLLLFVTQNPVFFLAGLVAFLVAHIFYIIFFHSIRVLQVVKPKPFLLIPVLIYYLVLIAFLSPHLGDMKLPVRIYGVVICFMLMLALHILYIKNKSAGMLMLTGAILFVISDSVLAINKFYNSFDGAGIIIMLTYGIAQLLLTEGAVKYLRATL